MIREKCLCTPPYFGAEIFQQCTLVDISGRRPPPPLYLAARLTSKEVKGTIMKLNLASKDFLSI